LHSELNTDGRAFQSSYVQHCHLLLLLFGPSRHDGPAPAPHQWHLIAIVMFEYVYQGRHDF